ncbi:MAG: glycosyltransferase [Planctomycetota bacterium]
MIFVTVGHQMPFDRLIRTVDAWAVQHDRVDLFAQIGDTEVWPQSFQAVPFLTPEQFAQRMDDADQIVGHAGTGTIIAALQRGKPLLVLPRRADLEETRNDHQSATADYFEREGYVLVARSETELAAKLSALDDFTPRSLDRDAASPQLIQRLRSFAFDLPAHAEQSIKDHQPDAGGADELSETSVVG